MTPDTILRRFTDNDLSAVYKLVQYTIDISYRSDYPENVIDFFKDYHTSESILEDAENGLTLVVLQEEQIIGTGTLLGTNIRRVFINPHCQRRGIGTLIWEELEATARSKNVPVLDLSSALGSRTFWESRGFTISEEIFAPAGNDRIIHYYTMTKVIG